MLDLNTLSPIPSSRLVVDAGLLPSEPGTYFVFFDSGQLLLERSGYLEFDQSYPFNLDGFDLLYVGATADSLRLCAMQQVVGDSRSSSLRMTVGALVADDLNLDPVGDDSRTYFNFGDGERRLTEWLCAYTRVAVHVTDQPFVVEKMLLRSLTVPFNISDRKRHPYSKYLTNLRALYAGWPKTERTSVPLQPLALRHQRGLEKSRPD